MIIIYCDQHPKYLPTEQFFPIEEPQNGCDSCELLFALAFKDDERLEDKDFVNGRPNFNTFLAKLNKKNLQKAISRLGISTFGTL